MADSARILVPCMDWAHASGGVRKIYQYVDWLNDAGLNAIVMHQQPGFRCSWFANATRVASFRECWPPAAGDVLIVPEVLAWQFVSIAPDAPKIILNQNAYQTFAWSTEKYNVNPYTRPEVLGVIVGSEDSRRYIAEVFPALPVMRLRVSVDGRLFQPNTRKLKQIAYLPRKKESDAKQVLAIARFRGVLEGFKVVEIKDKTLEQYSAILRDSLIFLSFSTQEGWGLPPMEAMASGCIVIGYDGRGGAEFMRQPYALPVPAEHVLLYAQTLESVLGFVKSSPKEAARLATQAAQFIHAAYPLEQERDDLLMAVRTLMMRRNC